MTDIDASPTTADPRGRRTLLVAAAVAAAVVAVVVGVVATRGTDESPTMPSVSDGQAGYRLEAWSDEVEAATALTFLPDGRALVARKGGWEGPGEGEVVVLSADGRQQGIALTLPVCTDAERGLVGMELDPGFAQNGYVYLYYTRQIGECVTAGPDTDRPDRESVPAADRPTNRLARFTMRSDLIDPTSEVVLLDGIDALQSSHNGGGLAFLPDGTLLVGVGEAKTAASRDVDTYEGKVLRVDPRTPGLAPADNPYASAPYSVDEPRNVVWASGLRNPFRLAVGPDGTVMAADVGTDEFEELNVVEAGKDYGFPDIEGPGSVGGSEEPVYWYRHENSCAAIIGGVFDAAGTLADDPGTFVFADFTCSEIYGAQLRGDRVESVRLLATTDFAMSQITTDRDGVVYIVPVGPGAHRIERLVRAGDAGS